MERTFENFDIWFDDDMERERPFMVACRDRTDHTYDEKWVLASLSVEEAVKVYEFLKQHLSK